MSTHSVSVLYAITCIAEGGSKGRKVERSSKIERTLPLRSGARATTVTHSRRHGISERKWKNGLGRRLTARLGRRLVTVCSARQPGAGPREGAPIQGGVGLYLRLCPTPTSLAHLSALPAPFGPRHAPSDVSIPSRNRTGKSDTRDEPTPTQLYWELQY